MYIIKSDINLIIVIDCSEPCKWVFGGDNLNQYEYYACNGFDYFGIYIPHLFDYESGIIRKKISVRLVKQLLDRNLHCFVSQYYVDSYKNNLIKN